LAKPELIK